MNNQSFNQSGLHDWVFVYELSDFSFEFHCSQLWIWNLMMNQQENDLKNRTCFYFDDIIKAENFNFDNILVDEKSYKNILV